MMRLFDQIEVNQLVLVFRCFQMLCLPSLADCCHTGSLKMIKKDWNNKQTQRKKERKKKNRKSSNWFYLFPRVVQKLSECNNEFSLFLRKIMAGTHISPSSSFYYKIPCRRIERKKREVIRLIAIEISPDARCSAVVVGSGKRFVSLSLFKGLLILFYLGQFIYLYRQQQQPHCDVVL